MSLISLPIKTAIFVTSVMITGILVSAGYVADMAATPELIAGIKNGITLALFIGAGLLITQVLYRVTPVKFKEMQEKIAVRRYVNSPERSASRALPVNWAVPKRFGSVFSKGLAN